MLISSPQRIHYTLARDIRELQPYKAYERKMADYTLARDIRELQHVQVTSKDTGQLNYTLARDIRELQRQQ